MASAHTTVSLSRAMSRMQVRGALLGCAKLQQLTGGIRLQLRALLQQSDEKQSPYGVQKRRPGHLHQGICRGSDKGLREMRQPARACSCDKFGERHEVARQEGPGRIETPRSLFAFVARLRRYI